MTSALEAQKEMNEALVEQHTRIAAEQLAQKAEVERVEQERIQEEALKAMAAEREQLLQALESAKNERSELREAVAAGSQERGVLEERCAAVEDKMNTQLQTLVQEISAMEQEVERRAQHEREQQIVAKIRAAEEEDKRKMAEEEAAETRKRYEEAVKAKSVAEQQVPWEQTMCTPCACSPLADVFVYACCCWVVEVNMKHAGAAAGDFGDRCRKIEGSKTGRNRCYKESPGAGSHHTGRHGASIGGSERDE